MKKLLILLLMFLCFSPLFAWKLVLDTSNLLQAIVSYTEKISEINQEIQYWRTQYTRIAKAAEGLVSGDFSTVLNSIASLSGTTSRMKGVKGNAKDILASIENDSLNLLDVYRTVDGYNIAGITDAIKYKIQYINNLSANGFKDFTYGGEGWDDVVSYGQSVFDAASLATTYATKLGNVAKTTKTFVDELFTVRRPSERYMALANLRKDIEAKYGDVSMINSTIAKYQSDIEKLNNETSNLQSDDSTKNLQRQKSIEAYSEKIKELEEIKSVLNETIEKENYYKELTRLQSIKEFEQKERAIERQIDTYIRTKSINEKVDIDNRINDILTTPVYSI